MDREQTDRKTLSVLHEKWSSSLNMDISEDTENRFRIRDSGSICYFYGDGTCEIIFWKYGMSMGYVCHLPINGKYVYKSMEGEISLTFDSLHQQIWDNRQVETTYYVLQNLKTNNTIRWGDEAENFPKLKGATLHIVEQGSDNKMWVQLFAYDEKREVVSFDTIAFVREGLK